ncbi:NACHT domain-containing protein [Streptomyces sp. NPDC050564]|uniref:NACHT domain-containing protein n=1 Tax=Streptomyces sp. NPDC050564 TaxID=3365631 RepID=UPI0037900424
MDTLCVRTIAVGWLGSGAVGVGLSYRDAVRLLGGSQGRTVEALDRLTGGLLLATSGTGIGLLSSLFDVRGELARLSAGLVQGLGERARGLTRFERSERMAAAHAVVVLAAYFEVLSETELPCEAGELELSSDEQVTLAGGGSTRSQRLGSLAAGLLRAEAPTPVPQRPYEATLEALADFYRRLSGEVTRFVSGLALWDRLDDTRRDHFSRTLTDELPERAVARYENLFRQLALDCPELAFWANLVDHQATRAQLRTLSAGLEGVGEALSQIVSGRSADAWITGLSRAHAAVLNRPILTSRDVLDGTSLPALGVAYVNPDYRVSEVGPSEQFATEDWWAERSVRGDLERFLVGHLTSPQAVRAPLIVLGQPGSGKSVLTQVLAARLPPADFLVVRVVLREAAADADLQTQIEHAVRAATGESVNWPELVHRGQGALPVVMLDGFDELLQATGTSQTDYLLRVADFQAREADQGRPVAVLVTSRTAVVDRARPAEGMIAVRLEPFNDSQVAQWLDVWNRTNADGFALREVRPLTAETVLAHGELASQPLLLLMLALYDSDRNALQRHGVALGQAELYERLLTSFAAREVRKTGAAPAGAQLDEAVERELTQLSIVAFAMFNRGRQWISATELDADLAALGPEAAGGPAPSGLRAILTAAQLVLGRFFFVHEARASREGRTLSAYEFLHATFGEFLVARLITQELDDLVDSVRHGPRRGRPPVIDDAFLHALMSFTPLTTRGTVVSFLSERLNGWSQTRRADAVTLVLGLFHRALEARHDTRYGDYTPQRLEVPARPATYSVNLVLLAAAATTADGLSGGDLFPDVSDPVTPWRRLALLWRSQCPAEGWTGLISTLVLERLWEDGRRQVRVSLRRDAEEEPWRSDPYWTYDHGPEYEMRPRTEGAWLSWVVHSNHQLREQARFLCDAADDIFAHGLEPWAGAWDSAVVTFFDNGSQTPVSAVNALVRLWLTVDQDSTPADLTAAFDACLPNSLHGFAPYDRETRRRFRLVFLRRLAADWERLDDAWVDRAMRAIREAGEQTEDEGAEFLEMAREILPDQLKARWTSGT